MLMNCSEYLDLLESIKQKIRAAQYKATVVVNNEMIFLYHGIGTAINAHKEWGNKFIDNLSRDIREAYPSATGYSARNLRYMSKFAELFREDEIRQAALAQITWYHHITLMDKVKDRDEYLWYVAATVKNSWTRNVMLHQVESGLFARQAKAEKISNFESRLPSPQSELAVQAMKDPYIFDFIHLREDMVERDIEEALVKDVTKLLLELGTGFAYLGHQYHLVVGGEDFYLDLLFYNIPLRCYVVVELKAGDFKPEYAGKLNFYLSAVDDLLRTKADNPSIGLLLCKSKNNVIAEYSLRDISKPIGVSEYRITKELPEELEKRLPSIEDIQTRIGSEERDAPTGE